VVTETVEEVVRVEVKPPAPEPDPAVAAAHEVSRELRAAVKELKSLGVEREAARRELAELRAQIQDVSKAAAEGRAALDRLRAEAQAAVAPVADLKHLCREAGQELRTEVGEESVVLVRLRQVREQADEAVQAAAGAGDRIRAFREACEKAAESADVLHLQARAAYLESLNEVLKGVARVRAEVSDLEGRLAELGREAARPSPAETRAAAPGTTVEAANRLGVVVDPGVVIDEVMSDGMAAAAGLARGDVIESVNGNPVHSATGLRDAVHALPDGAELTMRVRRGGDPLLMIGRLGPAAGEHGNRLGLVVVPGAVVAGVIPGSPAAAAGLARGDVIERAAGQEIQGGEQLRAAVQALPPGADVALAVGRAGEVREVVARLDRPSDSEPAEEVTDEDDLDEDVEAAMNDERR
jgi:hypothetical protein